MVETQDLTLRRLTLRRSARRVDLSLVKALTALVRPCLAVDIGVIFRLPATCPIFDTVPSPEVTPTSPVLDEAGEREGERLEHRTVE